MENNIEIYNKFLNPKIKKLSPYTPFKNNGKIKIRLDANESFYDLSSDIRDKIKREIDTIMFNRYPDVMCERLIEKYSDTVKINADNIVAGNGSDELISILINSFLSKNDKIITFTPDFSMYAFYSNIAEADVIYLAKDEENFEIDFKKVLKTAKEQDVKMIIFSNPCNPTGQITKKEVLCDFLEKCGCVVVVDEAYMDFCEEYSEYSLCTEESFAKYPNLIVLKTLSKAYGLASLRTGFMLSNICYINMVKMTKSPYNVNSISQTTAEIVLNDKDNLENHRKTIIQNKKDLQKNIEEIFADKTKYKVYKTYTNFIFIRTNEAKQMFDYLYKNSILIRNIGDKFLRITTGSEEENAELIRVLRNYYNGKG